MFTAQMSAAEPHNKFRSQALHSGAESLRIIANFDCTGVQH
jgi:hypothetical protein